MKNSWKKTVSIAALSTALLITAYPVWAADGNPALGESAQQSAITSYSLNDSVEVEIKSILNEPSLEGSKLGAVIRLRNTGSSVTRVPEYEVRVRTTEGIEYTLQPSSRNPKSIQPKALQELSYLSVVDQTETVNLAEVRWVDVDPYVYPKKETVMLTLPVESGKAWNGSDSEFDQTAIHKWGESFTLTALHSPIVYRPVEMHNEYNGKSSTTVVQLEASNPTAERQTLPAFTLDGKTKDKVFSGKRVEGAVTLEPNEKQYIHMLIPTDLDSSLTSLNVVNPEKFVTEAGEKTFNIGRLNILLPVNIDTDTKAAAPAYEFGAPFQLDSLNKHISPDMEVSLVELHMQENEGDGFQTAIAKFKVTNKGDQPLPIPSFQTELASKDGYVYSGSRQAATALKVVPNASYILNYSFALPSSEPADNLKISLYDKQATPDYSYNSILASYQVNAQKETESDDLSIYPYKLKVNNWSFSANYLPSGTYNYNLKLLLNLSQDKQVVTDANTSKLEIDVFDMSGSLLGSASKGFTGTGKLKNGENLFSINADSQQLDYPLTARVYETFTDENGETAKRLLTTFKQ